MTLLFAVLYAMMVSEGVLIVLAIFACQLLHRSLRHLEAIAADLATFNLPWRGDAVDGGAET